MGIQGLLPFVKKACRPANVKEYSGAVVAVDTYCWLHKGAFSCAEKLIKGEPTDGYVHYCMKMVNMLLSAGVHPILVFDGQHLPSKMLTEKKRRENRILNKKKAKEFLREGKLKEARECFQRGIDITPEMALDVIKACRQKNIDYIVAPYEADSQLAYLAKKGIAQLVITEDSDLILFGCEKILFKMDLAGNGLLYESSELGSCLDANKGYTPDKFRHMCILSGCDYQQSLHGIGLAKACKFFGLTVNPDLRMILKKLPVYLKMPSLNVTEEYIEGFIKADNTFLYQLVYCPLKKQLVPLNPYPPGMSAVDFPYAGRYLSEDLAFDIAVGNINVNTMQKMDNYAPPNGQVIRVRKTGSDKSISSKERLGAFHTSAKSAEKKVNRPFITANSSHKLNRVNSEDAVKEIKKEVSSLYSSDVDNASETPKKKEINSELEHSPKPTLLRSRFFAGSRSYGIAERKRSSSNDLFKKLLMESNESTPSNYQTVKNNVLKSVENDSGGDHDAEKFSSSGSMFHWNPFAKKSSCTLKPSSEVDSSAFLKSFKRKLSDPAEDELSPRKDAHEDSFRQDYFDDSIKEEEMEIQCDLKSSSERSPVTVSENNPTALSPVKRKPETSSTFLSPVKRKSPAIAKKGSSRRIGLSKNKKDVSQPSLLDVMEKFKFTRKPCLVNSA